MEIITVAVCRGGAGKTTTAAALAQKAAVEGKKVLAIDLDPQGNLSAFLGLAKGGPGSYELIAGMDPAETIQHSAQGADGITASADLATLKTEPGSARRLSQALRPIAGWYDLILIDTPPTLGELQYNALQASTGLLIPLEADTSSIFGLYQIAGIAQRIGRTNRRLKVTGVIVTRYDGRAKINVHLRDMVKATAEKLDFPYLGEIRHGIAIKEAQALRQSLFQYARKSRPALDYAELYNQIMNNQED